MERRSVGVIHESGNYVILDKPPGMISQGPRRGSIELEELLPFWWEDPGLVHRLDRWTSGVIIAGLSRKSRGYFQNLWHQITAKVYLAIIPTPSWFRKVVSVRIDGKSAKTGFEVLSSGEEGFSLVSCTLLENGRTHQIRKHAAHLGCSIVGDERYGGQPLFSGRNRGDFLLHAWKIRFRKPSPDMTGFFRPGSWVSYQASIPEDFRRTGLAFDWDRWDDGASNCSWYLEVPDWWERV